MKIEKQTITLQFPIETAGGLISEVTVSRPKTRNLRAIEAARDQSDFDQAAVIVRELTGLNDAEVDDLDGDDLASILEVTSGFFPERALSLVTAGSGDPS
jgi:hypothetical protein